MRDESIFIHHSANVSDKAIIGNDTKVWINSQIRENASIGTKCNIGKDTYIDFNVTIGNRVKIQNGVSVYHGITIGDDVFVGPNVCFTNDYYPRAFNDNWQLKETIVMSGASIGANATIVCGNTLGEYCMVGAGSVVTKSVAPFTLVVGNPARVIGKVCKCGERVSSDKCPVCGFILPNE